MSVGKEIYGRVFLNDDPFPQSNAVRAVDSNGVDHTISVDPIITIGEESWYRLVLRGTEVTAIIDNATFSEVDGAGVLQDWLTISGVTLSRRQEVLALGAETFRLYYLAEISIIGQTPPRYIYQWMYAIASPSDTYLQTNTTYTATVWCKPIVGAAGQIMIWDYTAGSYIEGTITSDASNYTKLTATFTTGPSTSWYAILLRITEGTICYFTAANVTTSSEVGFDEGEAIAIQVEHTGSSAPVFGSFAVPEDVDGNEIQLPFFFGSGTSFLTASQIDLYFRAPQTSVDPEGGTYNTRPEITLSIIAYDAGDTQIFYSVNSSSFVEYTMPFQFAQDGVNVLRWYGVDSRGNQEGMHSEVYYVLAPTYIITPPGGNYGSAQTIAFDTFGRAGNIYYTLNGAHPQYPSFPRPDTLLYAGPFELSSNTVVGHYFLDEFGTPTFRSYTWYYIIIDRPVIESFTINDGEMLTGSPYVALRFRHEGVIEITRLQFAVSDTTLSLEQLNSGDYDTVVEEIFADALYVLPQPVITADLLRNRTREPQLTNFTIYARAYTSDPASTTQFSDLVKASITLNTLVPNFIVNTVVDRNGIVIATGDASIYNSFTISGTKSSDAIIIKRINDGEEITVVSNTVPSTTWQYIFSLTAGTSSVTFVAESPLGVRSEVFEIEITVGVPPGVTTATTAVGIDGTWSIPFVFFDKGIESIPYHTFVVDVVSDSGLEPQVVSISDDWLLGYATATVSGYAEPGSIITLTVQQVE